MKPFKPKELVARIRARVRRTENEPAQESAGHRRRHDRRAPPTQVHARRRADQRSPRWSSTCWSALARKPRQVFTREVLLEQVWGYRHAADTRLVNVHVQRLRSKVEHDPENPEIVRDGPRRGVQGRYGVPGRAMSTPLAG